MPIQTTAAAILAGGRARRFDGRDKGRLMVDGRPIIVRLVEALQVITSDIFVVGHTPERFSDLNLPVFEDREPGLGALGGIATALQSTKAEHVLVVACDLPFLNAGLLRALVKRSASADAAWIQTERGPEPLIACYRPSALNHLRQAIAVGDLRAAGLGQRMTVNTLSAEDLAEFGVPERLLTNLNTLDDYTRIQ